MKPYRIAAIIALACIAISAMSCVTETTTTKFPDGREETVVKKYPAPGYTDMAAALAAEAIEHKIYSDKP